MAFVTLTKEQFEAALPEGYHVVDVARTWEVVYQIHTGWRKVGVRIYSTVDKRTGVTRDKGEDAIRVVYWDVSFDRPIGKGKKILRVEGATTIPERIGQRVEEFVRDVKKQNIVDFDYVKAILSSPAVKWSSFSTSLLEQLEERGRLSDNQLAYVLGEMNPRGKRTFESVVKAEDPGFAERYIAEGEVDNGTDGGKKAGAGTTPGEAGEDDQRAPWEDGEEKGNNPEAKGAGSRAVRSAREARKDRGGDEEGKVGTPHGQMGTGDALGGHPFSVLQNDGDRAQRLIPTTEYPDWKYPFPAFNPVQSEALSFRDQNINFVVSAATSCGKTVVAEFFIDHVLQNGV